MSLLVLTACGGSDDASEPAPSPIVLDSDADGVADDQDAFPNDANEWLDSDNDGFGDNSDAFVDDASEWLDSDGDGVGDNSDVFVNDASEWADSDGDGVGDNADAFPNDPNRWSEAVTLQLPQQLDNYAAVALPAHYLSNDFSDNNPFQRAAIVLDNTPQIMGLQTPGLHSVECCFTIKNSVPMALLPAHRVISRRMLSQTHKYKVQVLKVD